VLQQQQLLDVIAPVAAGRILPPVPFLSCLPQFEAEVGLLS
jgi:hypothetical protein